MTKEECAKVMAVKLELNYNTFSKSDKLKSDLVDINIKYGEDDAFWGSVDKYCEELRKCSGEKPRWARMLMAERYSLNV